MTQVNEQDEMGESPFSRVDRCVGYLHSIQPWSWSQILVVPFCDDEIHHERIDFLTLLIHAADFDADEESFYTISTQLDDVGHRRFSHT